MMNLVPFAGNVFSVPFDENLILALSGFLGWTLLLLLLVTWKYRTIFHPFLLISASLGVMAGIAPLVQILLLRPAQPIACLIESALWSGIYLSCVALPWLAPSFSRIFVEGISLLDFPMENQTQKTAARMTVITLLGVAGISFVCLIRESSAGLLWLTNPRMAYIIGRSGVGHWYVLSQACLEIAFILWLFTERPRSAIVVGAGTLATSVLFYWFGSKGGMLGVAIVGGLYTHFAIKPIGPALVVPGLCLILPLILISPWLQGSFDRIEETLSYYDYFDNSAMYLKEEVRIKAKYPDAWQGTIWAYIPRRFVPQKPFTYGALAINEYFWPGSAEQGYTPALLPWVPWHLYLGGTGVVIGGLLTGFLTRCCYSAFLQNRSLFGFLVLVQSGFIPIVKHVPDLFFLGMLLILATFLHGLSQFLGRLSRAHCNRPESPDVAPGPA